MFAVQPTAPCFPDLDALGVDYGKRDGLIFLSIPSEITFASGKADLTESGKVALKVVAGTLMGAYGTGNFWVEGHTDADPIKKSKWSSNRELSVARAMAVLQHLVEQCGVPDDQCVIAGHGQYSPVGSNEEKSGKASNRRVEIVVHASEG
jgi:chemotaxis protein MotB